jgi:transposase
MRVGRPVTKIVLSPSERETLERYTRRATTAQVLALRARIVLRCAAGETHTAIAADLHVTKQTVGKWRRRFVDARVPGLLDEPRPGAPRKIGDAEIERVLTTTLESTPRDATHWSTRSLAKQVGLTQATIARIWKAFALQPHRTETFKLSKDPLFIEKVRDIVGLYLHPPDRALVLCVDEKSQIQALDRTQPILGLRPGLPARQTHDYERHGTTTLFAALNVLEGTIIAECQPRHRHQEFLRFLERIDASVATGLEIHLVLDNYGTHKHPQVKEWLADRPRYHVHFTPTSSSWLNQIERWFAEITRKRIRRGTFRSVRDLIKAIRDYVRQYNKNPQPFQWVASASKIIRKVNKYKETLETGD